MNYLILHCPLVTLLTLQDRRCVRAERGRWTAGDRRWALACLANVPVAPIGMIEHLYTIDTTDRMWVDFMVPGGRATWNTFTVILPNHSLIVRLRSEGGVILAAECTAGMVSEPRGDLQRVSLPQYNLGAMEEGG
jgi:hypothetical protein